MYPVQVGVLAYNPNNDLNYIRLVVLFENEYQVNCLNDYIMQRVLDGISPGLQFHSLQSKEFEMLTDWSGVKDIPIVDFT